MKILITGTSQGIGRAILNIGSASGHTGAEFPEYCASKGGVIAYTKNVALRVAAFGAVCNSVDPGGESINSHFVWPSLS